MSGNKILQRFIARKQTSENVEIQRIQVKPADPNEEVEGHNEQPVSNGEASVVEVNESVDTGPKEAGNESLDLLEGFLMFLDYSQFGRHHPNRPWLRNLIYYLQKTFWTAILMSGIFFSLMELKKPVLVIKENKAKESESTYIKSGLVLLQLVMQFKLLNMILWDVSGFKLVVDLIRERSIQTKSGSKLYKVVPIALFLSSFALALVYTLLGFDKMYFRDYEFATLAWFQYEDIKDAGFKWSANQNMTYTEEFTPGVTVCSLLGFMSHFGSILTDFLIRDLLTIVALAMKLEIDKVDALRIQFFEESSENQIRIAETIMNEYEVLQKISTQLNKTFGNVTTLLHANNIFLCVSFFDELLNDPDAGGGFLKSTGIIKCLNVYMICLTSTEKVQKLQSWYRHKDTRKALKTDENVTEFCAVLDEMKSSPIGIGYGEYYINWQFARKLIRLMMTYYFILAKSTQQANSQKD